MPLYTEKKSALCVLDGDAVMFSSTPVDNLFIQEFMLNAPGDFVKVYIFGLMQSLYQSSAEQSMEKFSAALGMDLHRVKKAFTYWRNKGLMLETKQGYAFLNVRSAMYDSKVAANDDRLYAHSELSNRIEAVSKGRAFTQSEYATFYDLVDYDEFEEEAVVAMVEFAIGTYGKKITKSRLESIAREWKKAGRSTEAKARSFILSRQLQNSEANKILAKIGINYRTVSEAEHNLYLKWTNDWGFQIDAIVQVCETMTGLQHPNFKYLDRMLQTLMDKGQLSAQEISTEQEETEALNDRVRKCSFRLGITGKITDSQREMFKRWTEEYGLTDEAVVLLCDEASENGKATFKTVELLAKKYSEQKIIDADEIAKELSFAKKAAKVLITAGIRRNVTEDDKNWLKKWIQSFSMDVIVLAAEYAADSNKPMPYISRVLEGWKKQGVTTVDDARKQHENGSGKRSKAAKDGQSAIHFENEREYTQSELDDLMEDFSDIDE